MTSPASPPPTRGPLRRYVGMDFLDFKISLHKLSITFTKVELSPVESPILQGIFGALFPSAIVQKYEASEDHPPSKITIEKLKVALRMGIIRDGDDRTDKLVYRLSERLRNILFQRPLISIKLNGVVVEVEKAYVAPKPPPEFCAMGKDSLPSAVPPASELGPEIPVFDQDAVLSFFRDDELRDADQTVFWIERWSE